MSCKQFNKWLSPGESQAWCKISIFKVLFLKKINKLKRVLRPSLDLAVNLYLPDNPQDQFSERIYKHFLALLMENIKPLHDKH